MVIPTLMAMMRRMASGMSIRVELVSASWLALGFRR
jgi:hypothetical protein